MILARLRRAGPEAAWVGGGQLVAAAATFIGFRFLAGELGSAAYGELALAMTVVMLSQQVLIGPLYGGLLRLYAPACEAGQASRLWRAGRVLLRKGVLALGGLVLLLMVLLLWMGQGIWIPVLVASGCYAILSGYSHAIGSIQLAARARVWVAGVQGGGEVLRLLCAVAAVVFISSSATGAMLGYVVASGVLLAFQRFWLQRHAQVLGDVDAPGGAGTAHWRARLISYSWPFATWGGFYWAQVASERWALQVFADIESVGRYTLLYQLGYLPAMLAANALVQLIVPIIFARAGDGTDPGRMASARRLVFGVVLGGLAVTVSASAIGFAVHRSVFTSLLAAEYWATSHLWPLMILAGGLFAVGQVATLLPMARGATKDLIAPKLVTSVLAIGLNVLGAWRFGVAGVVWASLGFTAVYLVWSLWLTRAATGRSETNFRSVGTVPEAFHQIPES